MDCEMTHRRESPSPECAFHNAPATPAAQLQSDPSRRCTVMFSPLVIASASIRSSSPRGTIRRPRSAPACSRAMRMSLSISFSSTISPESACETSIIVARSSCSTGASIVPVGPGRVLVLSQPRMELVELPHLSVGSPADVAVAGRFANRDSRSFRSRVPRKSAPQAHWRAPRYAQSRLRVPNGWRVRKGPWHRERGHQSGRSPHQPAQRGSRSCPGNSGPNLKLPVMSVRALDVLLPRLGGFHVPTCRVRQRAIKVILGRFQQRQ